MSGPASHARPASHPALRALRDFAAGAVLALVIATAAFVAARNTELIARQQERAAGAADAIAAGRAPLPDVRAVLVAAAVPSKKHPYLRHRQVRGGGPGAWRALAAGGGPDDKLIYDAASRFERTGPFTELLRDGSGRAIAARAVSPGASAAAAPSSPAAAPSSAAPAPSSAAPATPSPATAPSSPAAAPAPPSAAAAPAPAPAVAIALTPPAAPAPYPWLVLVGVLGLGAALAAAGGVVGGRARVAGTFAGTAALAIPCALWRSPVAAAAIALVAAAIALAQRARLTDRFAGGVRTHRTALAFLAPAAAAMLVLVAAPFAIGLVLGFYDHHQGTWTFAGLSNFAEILSGGGRALDDPLNFWFILGVTVLWTLANVALHVSIGVALALVLSRTWLRGRGLFRMLLILPWAVPNYITALIWKGMFTGEYGAINSLLASAGLDHVSWFSSWATAFSANVITNTWLGFPFMMVVALGALESIPRELYEAASVDGASAWQRFRHITLPHLRPALGPAVALGSIWTFNMFNVIYLVSAGNPGGSTNILVTDAYRWAFERGERYGMAAAYATIIFLVLLLWTVFGTRIVRSKGAAA